MGRGMRSAVPASFVFILCWYDVHCPITDHLPTWFMLQYMVIIIVYWYNIINCSRKITPGCLFVLVQLVVALRQTRLVSGWVTVCGRVNRLGM